MEQTKDRALLFGWLNFRPGWFQFLNTPKWFLFFLSQYFFTQSIIVNGVYPGSISTIEKRFGLSSYLTGMVTSSYDIAALILTPLLSYMAGSRKKPAFCAWGVFTMGVGFFIFMLPHFITPPYKPDNLPVNKNATIDVNQRLELCTMNRTDFGAQDDCDKETSSGSHSLSYTLFILGMVVAGAGCTPMYALGIPYMDENVKSKVTPMYVGLFLASGIIGSVVGFIVISRFLLIFVELGVHTSLTPIDKRWVGNWWLGFAIFGALCVFWSVWLLGFPKEFPQTKIQRETVPNAGPYQKEKEDAVFTTLKELPKATKLVFSNPAFIFITLGSCFQHFVVSSSVAFMPKFYEIQFYLFPGKAAFLYGVCSISGGILGNLTGAYINRRLKLTMSQCARMCFIVSFLSAAATAVLFLNCKTPSIAGVNSPYENNNHSPIQLSTACNQACNCTRRSYTPVCGGKLSYFSPCHAGCSNLKETIKEDGRLTYSNCTCVVGDVSKGTCTVDHSCSLKLLMFLVLYSLAGFLLFLNFTPGSVVTIRCVPVSQQAYALGHQMTLARLLGAIPGPIVVGALIDTACILWDSKCGEKGYCLEYDHTRLTQVMFGVFIACNLITVVCFGLCWSFCKRLEKQTEKTLEERNPNELQLKAIKH